MDFGHTLRVMRTSKGISLRRLARQAGLSPTYLSQVETGKVGPPNHKRVHRIEEILGIPEGSLLGLTDRLDPRVARYLNDTRGATAFLKASMETGLGESDFLELTRLVLEEGASGMREILSGGRERRSRSRSMSRTRPTDKKPPALSCHLRRELIVLSSRARTKEGALSRVISEVRRVYPSCEGDLALESVLQRERQASTGIGGGIAIPHLVTEKVMTTSMGIFRFPDGVPFEAIDGEPVRLLFFLVGPRAEIGLHLNMLARITQLLNHDSFKNKLLSARTTDKLISFFKEAEERIR